MSRREEIGVGLLLLGGVAATAFLALQIGALSSWGDRIDVGVPTRDAAGLQAGAVVTAMGVPVGKIDRIELNGVEVVVHLSLEPSAQLRSDVTPRVRARSLLGEKYVELTPHAPDAPLLLDGDVLAPMPAQFEIDELVDHLGPLLDAMSPQVLADMARLGEALAELQQEHPEKLSALVDDLAVTAHNARLASEGFPGLVDDAERTLVAARATLSAVDARAAQVQGTLDRADALVAKLDAAAAPLPETVREARDALVDVRALVHDLDADTEDLDLVIANLEQLDVERIEHLLRDEGIRVRFAGRGADD